MQCWLRERKNLQYAPMLFVLKCGHYIKNIKSWLMYRQQSVSVVVRTLIIGIKVIIRYRQSAIYIYYVLHILNYWYSVIHGWFK